MADETPAAAPAPAAKSSNSGSLIMLVVILQTLSRKTSQDLINDDGKKKLRKEIQEEIGPFFKEPRLNDVMFTENVIQL